LLTEILADQDIQHKFEYHTHALVALVNIGEHQAECRQRIATILRTIAEDPDWELQMCLKPTKVLVRADPLFRIFLAGVLHRWDYPQQIGAVLAQLPLNAHERHLARKNGVVA